MSRADYAPSVQPAGVGGVIAFVGPDSPAARAGLNAGTCITRVDGGDLHDILDWQWLTDGTTHELETRDAHGAECTVVLRRADLSTPWGVAFTESLFDGIRTCRNSCAFCFMTQLPRGLRKSLYLRDDDYRLSFLQGNFITLTNLSDEDVSRISEQHLSPLYVSLHAVDPVVRARLVCAREDRALEHIDSLLESGVDLHFQIVLVPGVNDGDQLELTLTWLAEREGVASVGVVPLGYTDHQSSFSRSYNEPDASGAIIDQIRLWQEAMRRRDGIGWVYLADEFYLSAGVPLPPAWEYDDYPQYENGIGIARTFIDEIVQLSIDQGPSAGALKGPTTPVTIVTGALAAPVISQGLAAVHESHAIRLLPVRNRFFGGNVSVTGLLVGEDISRAVAEDGGAGIYLLPDIVLNSDGLTLDGLTAEDVRRRSGADVRLVSSDAAGLLAGLEKVGAELARTDKE